MRTRTLFITLAAMTLLAAGGGLAATDWTLPLVDQSTAQWAYNSGGIYYPGSSPYSGRSTQIDRVDNWLRAGQYFRMNVKFLSPGNSGARAETLQLSSTRPAYSNNKQVNYSWDYVFDCLPMWDKVKNGAINGNGITTGQIFYNGAVSSRFPYMSGGYWQIGKGGGGSGISYAQIKRTGDTSGIYAFSQILLTCDELKNADVNQYHVHLFVSSYFSTTNGWVTATARIWNGSSYLISRTATLYTGTPNWWSDYSQMPYWKGGLYAFNINSATTNDEWKVRIYSGSVEHTDITGPTGGMLTFASPVAPATAFTVGFSGWTDPNGPLTFEVLLDDEVVSVIGTSVTRSITAPSLLGTHTLKGRIYDVYNNMTEVSRNFTVKEPTYMLIQFL